MPTGSPRSEESSLLAGLGLAVGATLAFLLLLELLARGVEQLDPPVIEPVSRLGKRTEVPEPVPGAYRVYLFGGSTVDGAPVEALSFGAQLEFWLQRLSPRPVQVVNFGVNGRPSAFVRAEVERVLPSQPDLLVVLTAHNEFLRWNPDSDLELLRLRVKAALESTALVRLMQRVGAGLREAFRGETPLRLPYHVRLEARSPEVVAQHVDAYREHLSEVATLAREAGVPLILATGAANQADWPPVHRFTLGDAYFDAVTALWARIRAGEIEEAALELAALRREYPGDAMLDFLEGRIAVARGDPARAIPLFDRARDADPMPWRVLTPFNEVLRRLADGNGVHLADPDRAFRAAAPDGLVGWELMADNCHPTPLGSALLARELVNAMAREGLLLPGDVALPPLGEQWETFRRSLPNADELQLDYLLVTGTYVMKGPFHHFAAAERYLAEAAALAPDDWRIPANLGTLDVLQGRLEPGRARLARARELFGGPLPDHDRRWAPYLREAHALLAGEIEAFAPPREPGN